MRRKFIFFIALVLSWQMTLADEKQEVASRWRIAEIKVDGSDNEWIEAITYLEKEQLGFGLKNDSSDLYICLKFDRAIERQAMMFGFTLWFDPAAKNKKTFGVRFPIGMMNFESDFMPDPMESLEDGGGRQKQFAAMLREVEVLGPEKDDRNRFLAGSSFGIQAATFDSPAGLVCELKIPLQSAPGRPYAIAAALGQTLSVGFEMGELDREKMRERMGREGGPFGGGRPTGGMPPGGGTRGGGRFPGDRPEGGPSGGMRMPSAFKIWMRVNLAASASDSQHGFAPQDDLDNIRVSLEARNIPLREALQQIMAQTQAQIVYSDALVKDVNAGYSGKNVTLRNALNSLLAPTALDYRVMEDDQIVIIRRNKPKDGLIK
ncbi:STN domain-containing protein [candidate division KSB1 bacterium]|nr:STN domain-containing protein [candidate division KSB1 bacterium]